MISVCGKIKLPLAEVLFLCPEIWDMTSRQSVRSPKKLAFEVFVSKIAIEGGTGTSVPAKSKRSRKEDI